MAAQSQVKSPDLGVRLQAALAAALDAAAAAAPHAVETRAVVVGSDIPDLDRGVLEAAFVALERDDTDVVLGPAADGGYYLLGVKRSVKRDSNIDALYRVRSAPFLRPPM